MKKVVIGEISVGSIRSSRMANMYEHLKPGDFLLFDGRELGQTLKEPYMLVLMVDHISEHTSMITYIDDRGEILTEDFGNNDFWKILAS